MSLALDLEKEDVENVLTCIDDVLSRSEADDVRMALADLTVKIEGQTGVTTERHAPVEVPEEVRERFRRRAEMLLGEDGPVPAPTPPSTPCSVHSIDLFGSECPRCGATVG